MPGFLRSPQISQRQHCGISCPAQQLEGDHCVGGEHQQRGIGGGWRHGGQRRGYRCLDHRQPCCHQQAPGQGEGQADPQPPDSTGPGSSPRTAHPTDGHRERVRHTPLLWPPDRPTGPETRSCRSMIPAGPAPPGPQPVHRAWAAAESTSGPAGPRGWRWRTPVPADSRESCMSKMSIATETSVPLLSLSSLSGREEIHTSLRGGRFCVTMAAKRPLPFGWAAEGHPPPVWCPGERHEGGGGGWRIPGRRWSRPADNAGTAPWRRPGSTWCSVTVPGTRRSCW